MGFPNTYAQNARVSLIPQNHHANKSIKSFSKWDIIKQS